MTNAEFKTLRNICINADEKHDIWWCGFYFLHLTNKQAQCLAVDLEPKFGLTYNEKMNRNEVILPSGLAIIKK